MATDGSVAIQVRLDTDMVDMARAVAKAAITTPEVVLAVWLCTQLAKMPPMQDPLKEPKTKRKAGAVSRKGKQAHG